MLSASSSCCLRHTSAGCSSGCSPADGVDSAHRVPSVRRTLGSSMSKPQTSSCVVGPLRHLRQYQYVPSVLVSHPLQIPPRLHESCLPLPPPVSGHENARFDGNAASHARRDDDFPPQASHLSPELRFCRTSRWESVYETLNRLCRSNSNVGVAA